MNSISLRESVGEIIPVLPHTRLMRLDVTPMSNLPVRLLARMYTHGCFTASHRLLVPSYRRRCPASKDSLDSGFRRNDELHSAPLASGGTVITGIRSFSQGESYRLHSKTSRFYVFSAALPGRRTAKLISGRTFNTLPRDTFTVPVFTPRGLETWRARL